MSSEYGLGTASIGAKPSTPFAITGSGFGAVSSPLGVTYSYTSNTIGIGDQTFTVEIGKRFPSQGVVWVVSTTQPSQWMYGKVKVYNGNSLTITVNANQTNGSGTYASWGIYLISEPSPGSLPLYSITGLSISRDTTHLTIPLIWITAGSVRDSTDSVNLVLPGTQRVALDALVGGSDGVAFGCVVRKQLAGTISSSGTTVTGVGTSFTTDFETTVGSLTDLTDQIIKLSGIGFSAPFLQQTLISTSAHLSNANVVTNDTSLTTTDNLVAGAGTTYYRGGTLNLAGNLNTTTYGILIALSDIDGTTGIYATSFTLSGQPDLPPNTTYYRIIGTVALPGGFAAGGTNYDQRSFSVFQPLVQIPLTTAGQVLQSQNVTNPMWTSFPSLGIDGSVTGELWLAGSSGGHVRVAATNSTSTYRLVFPATAGSSGQKLITDGTGITSWSN